MSQVIANCVITACLSIGSTFAESQSLRVSVLPVGDRGVVQDLTHNDWKVKVGGQEAKVLSQRTPKDFEKDAQSWIFVFLPIRDPELRRLAVESVATFMTTLLASDAVLVVARTDKGLESLTPGFTTRPSLWEAALNKVINELPARLSGSPSPSFSLPASTTVEYEESIGCIDKLIKYVQEKKMDRHADDISNKTLSVMELYPPETLNGYSRSVVSVMNALERFAEVIAQRPGRKNMVLLSRCEVDDLANPIWGQQAHKVSRNSVDNPRLQVEMMVKDVTLARMALQKKLNDLDLTIHSVGGTGASYAGAFGEVSHSTGGFQYRFAGDLVPRLAGMLPQWAVRYELEVAQPVGVARPARILIETTRKDVRLFAPTSK